MCSCSSKWWKEILEWMVVTTAWFSVLPYILTSAINIKISLFKLDYLSFVWCGRLWLLFYPYRSSHRSSSAETSLSGPKYVGICMITRDFCNHFSQLWLESAGCNESAFWSGWLSMITPRTSRTYGRSVHSIGTIGNTFWREWRYVGVLTVASTTPVDIFSTKLNHSAQKHD